MISPERHSYILKLIDDKKVVTINELAKPMRVSPNTIRRDLQELEKLGLLRRTHGGAVLLDQVKPDDLFSYHTRQHVQVEAKEAVAQAALQLIKDGDSLILHSGTTVALLAQALKSRKDLTVLTNSLLVVQELETTGGIEVLLTGGSVDRNRKMLHGPLAENSLGLVRADKVFLSASSVSAGAGFSTSAAGEVNLEQASIRNCAEAYLLVDHLKFERSAFWNIAPLTSLTAVIVDKAIKPEYVKEMEDQGVKVILA